MAESDITVRKRDVEAEVGGLRKKKQGKKFKPNTDVQFFQCFNWKVSEMRHELQ